MVLHIEKDERGIKPGVRTVYSYDELNICDEQLIVELRRGNVSKFWKQRGLLPNDAAHWVVCDVEYIDADGLAWNGGKKGYNPTIRKATADEQGRVTGCGYVTEPEWVLEDTEENREKLLQEVERRFYGSAKTERAVVNV